MNDDLIRRQDAIRWVKTECNPYGKPTLDFESGKKVIKHLEEMSPAQSEPHWTPVTEGLPDPNKAEDACLVYYLIQNEYGDMMVASYHSSRYGETWWEQMYTYKPVEDEVVAWMPLPKPWSNNVDRNSN